MSDPDYDFSSWSLAELIAVRSCLPLFSERRRIITAELRRRGFTA